MAAKKRRKRKSLEFLSLLRLFAAESLTVWRACALVGRQSGVSPFPPSHRTPRRFAAAKAQDDSRAAGHRHPPGGGWTDAIGEDAPYGVNPLLLRA